MSTHNIGFYEDLTKNIFELSSNKHHISSSTKGYKTFSCSSQLSMQLYEPRSEKTGLRGFQPGPTQTGLYKHRRWLRD